MTIVLLTSVDEDTSDDSVSFLQICWRLNPDCVFFLTCGNSEIFELLLQAFIPFWPEKEEEPADYGHFKVRAPQVCVFIELKSDAKTVSRRDALGSLVGFQLSKNVSKRRWMACFAVAGHSAGAGGGGRGGEGSRTCAKQYS